MGPFESDLSEQLSSLETQGLRRSLRVVEESHGNLITLGCRELINFSSTESS